MKKLCLLIISCDKYSDLWDEYFKLLNKNWKGEKIDTYLVTDKPTNKKYKNVTTIVIGNNNDFAMRIKNAVKQIKSRYFLLTLDDYFIINNIYSDRLLYLTEKADKDNISYLQLYDRRKTNPRKYRPIEEIETIDLRKKYAVTLYPAIWEKSFLENSIQKNITAWEYEPSLTKYAEKTNSKCAFSHSGSFDILDVVRKGKVLNKANKYFKENNINIGDRQLISRKTEIYLMIRDWLSWHTPRKIIIIEKKILKKFGVRFYSED